MADAGSDSSAASGDEVVRSVARKRVKISKRYCPHCKETLSYKTFRTHKRLYYDSLKSVWLSSGEPPGLDARPMEIQPSPCSPPRLSPLASVTDDGLSADNDSPPRLHHDVGCFSEESSSSSDGPSGMLACCIAIWHNTCPSCICRCRRLWDLER